MNELSTIQKREKLNKVLVNGQKGNGGAYHKYLIISDGLRQPLETFIQFQDGARKLRSSVNGVLDTDLLEIVKHRLECFQAGEFATRTNAIALTHIEEALMWLNRRVEDRIEREVLGTNNK